MTETNSTGRQQTLDRMSNSPEPKSTLVLEVNVPFGPEPQGARPNKKRFDPYENLEGRNGFDIDETGPNLEMASYIQPGSTENVETIYHYSHVAIIARPTETDEDVIVDVEDGEEDSDEESEEERKRKRRRTEEAFKREEEADTDDMRLEDIVDYYLE